MASNNKAFSQLFFTVFLTAIVILGLISGCRIIPGPDYDSTENSLTSSSISGRIVKSSVAASKRQTSLSEVAAAVQNEPEGIANAEVWLEDLADDPNFHQTTDASGSYLFKNVPAGTHRVIARYLDSSTGLLMKNRSSQIIISDTPSFFTAPAFSCLPAENIVTGQLRDVEGNFLPAGTILKIWGETFTIEENGQFKSLPMPGEIKEARIIVILPGGNGQASFMAPFVSAIVPVFIELQVGPSPNGNHAPTVTLSASVNGEPVSKVSPGTVVNLKAVGSDANSGDVSTLVPNWSTTIGTLSNGASDFEKIWTAPNLFTVATISVEVRDSQNAAGKAQLPILIGIDSPDQVDTAKPEVTLSASLSEVKDSETFVVTITFNEPVNGFDIDDISVSNGTAQNLEVLTAGKVFSADVTPLAEGQVIVSIPENIVTDMAGNSNIACDPLTINHTITPVLSSAKEISSFSLLDPAINATINQTNKTIELSVPYGTALTALIADFTVSDKAEVEVNGFVQTSGVTQNDFSSPVIYKVTAEDGSVTEYIVTINIEAPLLITNAEVTIEAPVMAQTPQTAAQVEAATANADFAVTGLIWNESLTDAGKFKAGLVYTATITLTSKNSKKFQTEAFTPTVDGAASVGTTTTTGSEVGNSVTFVVTFAATNALAVTGIEITTQPTKLNYAEATDDVLALNGLAITETYNDGSTNVVTFTDGTATGYSAEPSNGTVLTNVDHSGKSVTITHTASGKTANTSNLTVSPIVEIAAAQLSITAPVVGAAPQTVAEVETATANADYTVTDLTWNEAMTAAGKFNAGQVYTATITLTSKSNKKFQAEAFTPTVDGAASVGTTTTAGSEIGNSVTFVATFAATDVLAVTGIEVTGQPTKLDYAEATDDVLALNGLAITETYNDGSTNVVTFTDGTATGYSAEPSNGTVLTNVDHSGKPVTITHTASGKTANTSNLTVAPIVEIAAAQVSITAPVVGANPQAVAEVETATANADYTVTDLTWNEAMTPDGKFNAGQVYTATITLTSKSYKKFQAEAFTPTVAGAASVGTTTTTGSEIGNSVAFVVTFAATDALAVTGIEVTGQPAKRVYDEATDPILALNGLAISETYNDGSTNVVTFTDGTAAGYTATPGNGSSLTNASHDANPVSITHTASGKTAATANLTVAPIVEITAAEVVMTAPVLGQTPQTVAEIETATTNADYTVTGLSWNQSMTEAGKFRAGRTYVATVTLTSKNYKKFQSAAFTPVVAGSSSVSTTNTNGTGIGNTVTFSVTFPDTEPLEVTALFPLTQPEKLKYTSYANTLSLKGLTLHEMHNDGSSSTISFANGTPTDYTTLPENGATLSLANNGQSILITHTPTGITIPSATIIFLTDHSSATVGNLRAIPGGSFQHDADPANVTVVSDFRMSQYEITRTMYKNIIGIDPVTTASTGTNDPVQKVNWYEALVFCNELSIAEGLTPAYSIAGSTDPADWGQVPTTANDAIWDAVILNSAANGYRLPTEAEWLWAAMGGHHDSRANAIANDINISGYNKAFAGSDGSNSLMNYAWYTSNALSKTHPFGQKLANELGLYDMSGNVSEWCWDWSVNYPTNKIARGGNYSQPADYLAFDFTMYNSSKTFLGKTTIGFRVVRP